ncbi:hypothetical protein [Deinococcus grandis]|nr:hypothetical protein [Deinococcus grandis]
MTRTDTDHTPRLPRSPDRQCSDDRRSGRKNRHPEAPQPAWLTEEKLTYHRKVMVQRHADAKNAQRAEQQRIRMMRNDALSKQVTEAARQRALDQAVADPVRPWSDDLICVAQRRLGDTAAASAIAHALYGAAVSRDLRAEELALLRHAAKASAVVFAPQKLHRLVADPELHPHFAPVMRLASAVHIWMRGDTSPARFNSLFEQHAATLIPAATSHYLSISAMARAATPWPLQYALAMHALRRGDTALLDLPWHPLVQAAVDLGRAGSAAAARAALESFEADICAQAYVSTAPLDLRPFLPACTAQNVRVIHCEGRPWKDNIAFCPTLGGPCTLAPNGPARLSADRSLPAERWSVLELLDHAGPPPMAVFPEVRPGTGLRKNEELTSRLGGWLNRLNRIRPLLKCSHEGCGQTLITKKGYARFLASYPVTIFNCPETGKGHDRDVKLTHCWGCNGIIDSRKSRYQDGMSTYNVCLNCAAGERNAATVGDTCPHCGHGPMRLGRSGPIRHSPLGLHCTRPGCRKVCGLNSNTRPYLSSRVLRR